MARPQETPESTKPPMPEADAAPLAVEDASLADLLARLVDQGKTVVRTEAALWRARASDRLKRARLGLIGLVVALLLAQAAFIALVVGMVLVFSASLGVAGGTFVAVAGAALLAGGIGWLAVKSIARATRIGGDR